MPAHADGRYNSAWARRQEISIDGVNGQLSSHNSNAVLGQIPANMAGPNGWFGVQMESEALRKQPMIPAPGIDLGRIL